MLIDRILNRFCKNKLQKQFDVVELNNSQRNMINQIGKYTLTNEARLWQFIQACDYCNNKKIKGSIVECGVWRGGYLMLAGLLQQTASVNREIFGYDTFTGMAEPSSHDFKTNAKNTALEKYNATKKDGYVDWCYESKENVKNEYEKIVGNVDGLNLIKGDICSTLLEKGNIPDEIAILRLDTDFYESTKVSLELLVPKVVDKGWVIIDDYGSWEGCRKAVDEYFQGKNVLMHRVDKSCRAILIEKFF